MLINKLLPIIIFFFAGYGLKKAGVFAKTEGALFLRAVLYLCLPLVAFSTFSQLELGFQRLFPIISGLFVITGNFLLTKLYIRRLGIPPRSYTVYLLGTIILNTSMMLPFAQARWGTEGAGVVLLFDICHVTMVFTFSYWVAMRYGNQREGKVPLSKIFKIPPLWGILLGIIVNVSGLPLPGFVAELTAIGGKALILLMMVALGIFFELKLKHFKLVVMAMLQRSAGGILLGLIITTILGVKGIDRSIILMVSAAPMGFNTLVLSDLEDLDRDLAAEMVTTSTLVAVILLPIILLFI